MSIPSTQETVVQLDGIRSGMAFGASLVFNPPNGRNRMVESAGLYPVLTGAGTAAQIWHCASRAPVSGNGIRGILGRGLFYQD